MSRPGTGTIEARRKPGEPVAVIAMGAMFPGRGTTLGFFRDLIEGVDAIGDVPPTHWRIEDYYDPDPLARDRTYGRRGGFLAPQAFNPVKFGLPPAALPSTDTSQLLALMVADRVMADVEAALGGAVDRERTSVVLGVASATELTGHMAGRLQRPVWERALRASGLPEDTVRRVAGHMATSYIEWTEATFPGLLGNVVAGRIANRLNLGGSNLVTDAACASSLAALQLALHELRSGASDMVLAGGADALNDILMYLCFSKTPALSPTGDCRPFSAQADGTILGEGIGMLALKRLADAERDGDRIHAVIRGLGGASDGRGTAIYAPLPSGQARALRRAYADAGYGPETVGLVEAHGTGTQAGHRAELEGLKAVFAPDGPVDEPWCALGSVKSQIGHTKAAAGAASLIKAVMALSRQVLPPTLKVDAPAPTLAAASPFYLSGKARPWVHAAETPRRAAVSSFGFGGSNFHVTLEAHEGPGQPARHRLWPSELLLFSAADGPSLARAIEAAREAGEDATSPDALLPHLAERLAQDFDPGSAVAAYIVTSSKSALLTSIDALLARLDETNNQRGRRRTSEQPAPDRPLPPGTGLRLGEPVTGQTAFLFSGQGSQYVGMGADLALALPQALAAWDEAAGHAALEPLKLHDRAFPPPAFDAAEAERQAARLTEMVHAQPAIAVTALAQLDILRELGIEADMAAGHSFGELVALYHGGAMDRSALLTLSRARAEAMTAAANGQAGAMLAVRAAAGDLADRLRDHPGITLANDNGPSQVTLSGSSEDIEALRAELQQAGLTVRRLPVASAFHSPIVAPAVAPFRAAITDAGVRPPDLPVFANTTARPYGRTAKTVRSVLANQIRQPVRFREMIEEMYRDGARTFVEIGPGSVVSGLVSDILGARPAHIVALDHRRKNGLTSFLEGLGALSINGCAMAFDRLYAAQPAPPLPEPPARFAVEICGANYGKPTPDAPPVAPCAVHPAPETQAPPHARTPCIRTQDPDDRPGSHPHPAPPDAGQPPSLAMPEKKTPTMSQPRTLEPGSVRQTATDRAIAEISAAHRLYLETMARLVGGTSGAGGIGQVDPAPEVATPSIAFAAPVPPSVPANDPPPPPADPARPGILNGRHRPEAAPAASASASQARAPLPAAATDAAPHAAAADLAATLKSLVAEKTGYPEDMLDEDMLLEAELGIDSIKQVEILSAIAETYPDLPPLDPEDMAELTTIGAIARHLAQAGVNGASQPGTRPVRPTFSPEQANATPAPAPAPATPSKSATATRANGGGAPALTALLKSLVAEKTGYPEDMLEDDMDLEAELGVDSIKQVEILSALREARPDLQEIDPEDMGELRSIADLAAHFH